MLFLKLTLAAIFVAVLIFCTGCNNQPKHPNQLNAFDGASYDSLTATHAALASLRSSISTTHRQYITPFNQAADSYSTAFAVYGVYRTTQSDQTPVTLAIANLTVSIVSLENTFQSDMKASPADVQHVRMQAARFRTRIRSRITVSDILTELEIAASVASTIPATQPYSGLATLVIKMTEQAVGALNANSGHAIDLSTIQPLPPIQ